MKNVFVVLQPLALKAQGFFGAVEALMMELDSHFSTITQIRGVNIARFVFDFGKTKKYLDSEKEDETALRIRFQIEDEKGRVEVSGIAFLIRFNRRRFHLKIRSCPTTEHLVEGSIAELAERFPHMIMEKSSYRPHEPMVVFDSTGPGIHLRPM